MHHHHHHSALIPNGLAMSSNLNNNSIQTNNNLTNKLANNHQMTNSTKNNNGNSNDTENHRHRTDNKTGPLSSNNSSSNSPNHLSSRPATPGTCPLFGSFGATQLDFVCKFSFFIFAKMCRFVNK